MKKVYNLFAVATLLMAGATSASARHWGANVSEGAVTTIVPGQTYVLQPAFTEAANGNCFFAGQKFTTTTSLTLDNIFVFEAAGDNNTFYLKRKGLNENQYLADPSNHNFYTSATDRAWKLQVKPITETKDREKSYDWTHPKADGADTTETIRGVRAYVEEAKANGADLDMSTFTFVNGDNAVVLVSPESKKKDDKYSEYNFLLTCPSNNLTGGADKGTDYNRNAWLIYATNELSAKDDLKAVIAESLGANFSVDELSEKFPRGNNIGEYDKVKYDAFLALYNKSQAILNGETEAPESDIDQLIVDLPKAYAAFTTSGKVLEPGYYILTSYRSKETGYDGGALYDGGAVNEKDNQLRWTYKGGDITYNQKDSVLNYKSLKYIWKVTRNEAKPGYFFFQNLATKRYVGTAQNVASNGNIVPSARIEMTNGEEASYNIVTSRNYPGYFCFYSPDLWRGKGNYWSYNGGDRWQFGGVHTGSDHNGTVVWDWQADGSTFKARTITEQEVQDLLKSAEQDINNEKAQKLIAEAQNAYDRGFAYMGVDASGNRIEESTNGELTNKGLITNGENLSSPMADKDEGMGEQHSPAVLLDSKAETFFHTSWHGGDDAWKGGHFLQFKLDNPEKELLLKWVKRNNGNGNDGAPEKITIWGAKSDTALEAGKADKVDQDGNVVNDTNGNPVVDFDAWKKNQGWDSLVVSTFTYPYTVTWQGDNGNEVKKTNFAGTAYFKLPADKGTYKYFRMEVTKTVGNGNGNGNKYFHGSEFRVYKGAYDGQNSLIDAVPQTDRTALTTAIATLKGELNTKKATKTSIEALRAAYDQFLKNYPDPTRVTKAIAAAKALEKAAEESDEVGYYATGSKDTYKTAIETVENNLKEITAKKQPTVAQVNDLLAQVDAANKAFAEKLNVPAEGIYRIVSKSSEAGVADNSVVANTPSMKNYLKLDGRMKDGSIYKDVPNFKSRLGAYWKLTKVAGGYTYQNLYTGLYLAPKEEKGTRVMSLRKAPYTLGLRYAKTPGCFNLVADTADVQDKAHVYVNAEPGSKNLVLWNEANGKDNSAFSFTEAQEDLEEVLEAEFSLPIQKGVPQIITLPIAAEAGTNNFYTVIGQDAENKIQLKKHTGTLEAGQAYVLIPEAGSEASVISLISKAQTIATLAPVSTPATPFNGLVPVFETTKVSKDSGVFNADHSKVLLSEVGESVAAGSGYFSKMPVTTETGDKFLETNGTITTVGRVVANGQLVNAVYTLSGVRVKGTKHLPAGLYIVNGKKVVVK